jgi:inositol 1,4,5-triphosphate receptor type 1
MSSSGSALSPWCAMVSLETTMKCVHLIHACVNVINHRFQMFLRHTQMNSFVNFVYLSIYQVTFFICITTIGLNIIFGIIVDTFSELRDLKVRSWIFRVINTF